MLSACCMGPLEADPAKEFGFQGFIRAQPLLREVV